MCPQAAGWVQGLRRAGAGGPGPTLGTAVRQPSQEQQTVGDAVARTGKVRGSTEGDARGGRGEEPSDHHSRAGLRSVSPAPRACVHRDPQHLCWPPPMFYPLRHRQDLWRSPAHERVRTWPLAVTASCPCSSAWVLLALTSLPRAGFLSLQGMASSPSLVDLGRAWAWGTATGPGPPGPFATRVSRGTLAGCSRDGVLLSGTYGGSWVRGAQLVTWSTPHPRSSPVVVASSPAPAPRSCVPPGSWVLNVASCPPPLSVPSWLSSPLVSKESLGA